MMNFEEMINKRFGKLVVLKKTDKKKYKTYFLCQCDCGNKTIVEYYSLIYGNTKSCGCLQKEKAKQLKSTHNDSKTRLYTSWCNMKARCYRKTMKRYERYGGRGIVVCDEWKNSFITFKKWALENGYNESLTLDRIDVNGNYEPNNCRWISNLEQQSNRGNNRKITYKGETKALCEWARIYNLKWKTLQNRINDGWDIEKALTTTKLEHKDLRNEKDKRSKKIVQKSKNGDVIKLWPSIKEINREKGYASCSIINVCKHKKMYNTAYGYKWEYYCE